MALFDCLALFAKYYDASDYIPCHLQKCFSFDSLHRLVRFLNRMQIYHSY